MMFAFVALATHLHVQLKVRDPRTGKLIFRTKAAQIYPWALCASIAMNVTVIYEDALAHLSTTFCLTTPVADRKRELGSSKPWPGHRQADAALKAQWAGYQLKHGAAKLLLDVELEPGRFALPCWPSTRLQWRLLCLIRLIKLCKI